jgi:hypothetical protein
MAQRREMLFGSFSPGSDFSRFAVSTYGFSGRKSLRGEKSSEKPAPYPATFISPLREEFGKRD